MKDQPEIIAAVLAIAGAILAVVFVIHHPLITALIAVGLVLARVAVWMFHPGRHLPKHRARHMRLRLRLHLHPARGHASAFELFWHWSALAAFRESSRTRPDLRARARFLHPAAHSLWIGRAHWRRKLRVPVQENMLICGPPRFYKSALLAHLILEAKGPVISTSSKPDQYALTSAARAKHGKIYVFDPQGIARGAIARGSATVIPVKWDPVRGCEAPEVAIRRADSFANASSARGADGEAFWTNKLSDALRGVFSAAALSHTDIRQAARWAGGSKVQEACDILDADGRGDWAAELSNDLDGPAEKTVSTIRMLSSRALASLRDPALAAAMLPGDGEQFDVDEFLIGGANTLYMVAKGQGEDCVLAPVFAALIDELHWRATQLAAFMPGHRLAPSVLFALDEVASIAPIRLADYTPDSSGQGLVYVAAFHGLAQLRRRWGADACQSILDTVNLRIFMGGLADDAALQQVSRLCGQAHYREHGHDTPGRHDVMSPDMIRAIPRKYALALRNNLAPVIFRIAAGWNHPEARRAARELARAERVAVAALAADIGALPVTEPEPEVIVLPPVPEPEPAASSNGHKQVSGDGMGVVLEGPWKS